MLPGKHPAKNGAMIQKKKSNVLYRYTGMNSWQATKQYAVVSTELP